MELLQEALQLAQYNSKLSTLKHKTAQMQFQTFLGGTMNVKRKEDPVNSKFSSLEVVSVTKRPVWMSVNYKKSDRA